MLDVRINNESMDLPPAAQMEVEENNPYLQFAGDIAGEYSLPLEAPLTAKNNRLLKYAGVFQKRVDASGIDAVVFDSGFQHSLGKLKIEKIPFNLNRSAESRISFYYLTGTSFFWQDLKNKKLRDVELGGARQFAWDNYNRSGNGFWGHIHKVIDAAPASYDYAFYPVLVTGYEWGPFGSDLVNNMQYTGGQPTFSQRGSRGENTQQRDANIIVPFPYLKYVLEKAVEHVGWKIEGDILSDPDFNKVTMLNQRAIEWVIYAPATALITGILFPKTSVSFNLKNHVPDIEISTFLMALRNRFGWWYDIDKVNKIVRIRKLITVAAAEVKDMSSKASPLIPKTILTEKKIYAVRNSSSERELKLSDFIYDGERFRKTTLPPATAALVDHVMLVISDNNFYICEQLDNGSYSWEILSANTADVVPDGASEEVTGNSSVPDSQGLNAYLDIIPRSEDGGYWPGRTEDNRANLIELCFYHGKRPNKSGQLYPYGHHHIYDSAGNQVGEWSLSLKGKKEDGTEVGLYDLAFKPFLDKLVTTEELEVTLYLKRMEFLSLKFSDVLIINGVRMYIKTKRYLLPYKNAITLACLRVQQ